MCSEMTEAEKAYSKAMDDSIRLEPLVMEQIAALLDGQSITIDGKKLTP